MASAGGTSSHNRVGCIGVVMHLDFGAGFMIRVFLKGQNVPQWLETIEPKKGYETYKIGSIVFGSFCLCWMFQRVYEVTYFGNKAMIISDCENVTIMGQGNGVVWRHWTYWFKKPPRPPKPPKKKTKKARELDLKVIASGA